MKRIDARLTAVNGPFEIPVSTGYQTYGALLSLLSHADEAAASQLHDNTDTTLVNGGINGAFGGNADRPQHKTVLPRRQARYSLRLSISDPNEKALFDALVKAVVIDNESLSFAHGEMKVTELDTAETAPGDILDTANRLRADGDVRGVRLTFERPVCHQPYGEVYEQFPHRTLVFPHLAARWNVVTSDEDKHLNPTAEMVGGDLITKIAQHDTASPVVARIPTGEQDGGADGAKAAADGGGRLKKAQGYQGTVEYQFKQASEATKTAVLALAKFAEYAGIGAHNARGCGVVSADVIGGDWV